MYGIDFDQQLLVVLFCIEISYPKQKFFSCIDSLMNDCFNM